MLYVLASYLYVRAKFRALGSPYLVISVKHIQSAIKESKVPNFYKKSIVVVKNQIDCEQKQKFWSKKVRLKNIRKRNFRART